ncbi:DUF2304 family protein [Rhodoplanes serenus]|uniref:DUF2304 family protein n=1 Tax=Rhodoplanes serenus TaxID=200615 RepID=A0A9X5ASC6_9BRAD|nr:DUF2304 domain-containing protein [Rhodoplanes serenus]MTW15948.1 DUF2304 family protein [Rhodoplanes serenus]
MIAQVFLSVLLAIVLLYAVSTLRKAPVVGIAAILTAMCGLYLVWFPSHATGLAHLAGVGRGADLVVYTWVVISLLMLLNLHLKLRAQMEEITRLARAVALAEAARAAASDTMPPATDTAAAERTERAGAVIRSLAEAPGRASAAPS